MFRRKKRQENADWLNTYLWIVVISELMKKTQSISSAAVESLVGNPGADNVKHGPNDHRPGRRALTQ